MIVSIFCCRSARKFPELVCHYSNGIILRALSVAHFVTLLMYSVGLKTSVMWLLKGTVMATKPKTTPKRDHFCPVIFQILNWNALIHVIAISLPPGLFFLVNAMGVHNVLALIKPSLLLEGQMSGRVLPRKQVHLIKHTQVFPRKRETSPRKVPISTALPDQLLGSLAFLIHWARLRQQAGNFCLREVWNTDLNVWCLV